MELKRVVGGVRLTHDASLPTPLVSPGLGFRVVSMRAEMCTARSRVLCTHLLHFPTVHGILLRVILPLPPSLHTAEWVTQTK